MNFSNVVPFTVCLRGMQDYGQMNGVLSKYSIFLKE